MLRAVSLALCLAVPTAAFADDLAPAPPAADQPTPAALTPQDPGQPQPAVENARWCGTHGCGSCGGRGKFIVITGVAATVLTAVAVGVAVGVATHHDSTAPVTK